MPGISSSLGHRLGERGDLLIDPSVNSNLAFTK